MLQQGDGRPACAAAGSRGLAVAMGKSPGSVVAATQRDLERLPDHLAESALAASALALAAELDGGSSATSKSMCAKAHMEIMNRLSDLAPPKREADGLDDLSARRAARLSGSAGA